MKKHCVKGLLFSVSVMWKSSQCTNTVAVPASRYCLCARLQFDLVNTLIWWNKLTNLPLERLFQTKHHEAVEPVVHSSFHEIPSLMPRTTLHFLFTCRTTEDNFLRWLMDLTKKATGSLAETNPTCAHSHTHWIKGGCCSATIIPLMPRPGSQDCTSQAHVQCSALTSDIINRHTIKRRTRWRICIRTKPRVSPRVPSTH